ncbi:hypothetical protein ACFL1B_03110 [Nanoarchaeota archaeon]
MENFAQSLLTAKSVEERADILSREIAEEKEGVEKWNGGSVLEIQEHEGLHVGDLVSYRNALGQPAKGYVSHFFVQTQETSGEQLAKMCQWMLRDAGKLESSDIEHSKEGIVPVVVPLGSSSYSKHHGPGMPVKIDE